MNKQDQIEKALAFKAMHKNNLLLLPNAWNGGSAKVFEKADFPAVGTTSAGIAYSLGYPDGEKITFDDITRVTKEILRVISIPLTVDVERGYSDIIDKVKNNVREIIATGAVGINLEDGIPEKGAVDDIEFFCSKIEAVAKLKEETDIPFVINARTDIFLLQIADQETMFEITVERAKALQAAGADCLFVPGPLNEEMIIRLRNAIDMPINLFLHSAFCNTAKMAEIGINRLSSGSAPVRSVFNTLTELAEEYKAGNNHKLLNHKFNYAEANNYFGK